MARRVYATHMKIFSPLFRNAQSLAGEVTRATINSPLFPRALRARAWAAIGLDVDSTVAINSQCFLGASENLHIGRDCFVNHGCFFDLSSTIAIGERCLVGCQSMFITSFHNFRGLDPRAVCAAPIVISDDVWIGARVTILPGANIGSGSIIGAGAVVVGDCEPNGLYAGVPAVRVKELGAQGSEFPLA